MATIHEKIVHLLDARQLKRRDLAQSLGVSPQTATDICKGRSAITLPHLRALVRMFDLRPDYWLDDSRLQPEPFDHCDPVQSERLRALATTKLVRHRDPAAVVRSLETFAAQNSDAFRRAFPDLQRDALELLGIPESGQGQIGRISGS